jgi:hypothetical protein
MEGVLVAFGILGTFALIGYALVRLLRLVIKPAKHPTLSEVLGVPGGKKIRFERQGRTFFATFVAGYRSSPNRVRLLTRPDTGDSPPAPNQGSAFVREVVDTQPLMLLRGETNTDRWGKNKALNLEIQTGDEDFDKKVYVESDSGEALVRRTLANPALRRRIVDLLSVGVREVVLDRMGLYVHLKFESVDGDGPAIRNALPKLAEIASLLPVFASRKFARRPHYYFEYVAGAIAVGIFLFLVNERITLPLGEAIKVWSGGIGLTLATAVTGLARHTLRGTSVALRRISSIGIFAVILCPLGSYWLLAYFNQVHDTSTAVHQRSTVARAWTSTHKSSTHYHIEVRPWHPAQAGVELVVSEGFSRFAAPGTTIEVTTHLGRLGFEWIESYRIAPNIK